MKRKKNLHKHSLQHEHRGTRRRNIVFFIGGILVAILFSRMQGLQEALLHIHGVGIFGAFFAGIFFVSTITVSVGAVLLLLLAEKYSILQIALIAGFGAVVGDLVIFRFVQDTIVTDIRPIYHKLGGSHLTRLLHTKFFSWTLPVIGAIIIASPLPDELGVSLMGLSTMSSYKLAFISYILNTIGIFAILSATSVIKP